MDTLAVRMDRSVPGRLVAYWSCPLCKADLRMEFSGASRSPENFVRERCYCEPCLTRIHRSTVGVEEGVISFLKRGSTRHQVFYGSMTSWMSNLRDRFDNLERAIMAAGDHRFVEAMCGELEYDDPQQTLSRAVVDLISVVTSAQRGDLDGRGKRSFSTSRCSARLKVYQKVGRPWLLATQRGRPGIPSGGGVIQECLRRQRSLHDGIMQGAGAHGEMALSVYQSIIAAHMRLDQLEGLGWPRRTVRSESSRKSEQSAVSSRRGYSPSTRISKTSVHGGSRR